MKERRDAATTRTSRHLERVARSGARMRMSVSVTREPREIFDRTIEEVAA
jgi:hypothetical protein